MLKHKAVNMTRAYQNSHRQPSRVTRVGQDVENSDTPGVQVEMKSGAVPERNSSSESQELEYCGSSHPIAGGGGVSQRPSNRYMGACVYYRTTRDKACHMARQVKELVAIHR